MTKLQKRILNFIQGRFPIVERPYMEITRQVDSSEPEVLAAIKELREEGIIRRIGGNFVPEKVGFVSTLCAAKVPQDKLGRFAETVNAYPGVTHNYLRENDFNVWFTFIAPSREVITKNLADISNKTGVKGILNLPATRVFKIKAQFNLK